MSVPERRAMVERPGEILSVRRQCELLNLARSGVYRPGPVTGADDLALMRRIDELHLKWPFYGSRRMVFELNQAGHGVNRKRVQRLMRVMGIEALVPRPGTSKAAPGHKIYPYLLRGVSITEPNHVWASDITYIPMAQGFLYLVAIIDWASRAVLAWRLSNTMDTGFCIAALDEALARHGTPKIFNTDQGAQFTSSAFTGRLEAAGIAISMDGRGRFMDNIFIERLWRSIKYEEIHLKAYADGREARDGIGSWMNFYNHRRPHQAMNNQFPMAAWRAGMARIEAAKTVDMPLRLDNANALPTYPQQTQTQQKQAADLDLKDKGRRDHTLTPAIHGPSVRGPLQLSRTIRHGHSNIHSTSISMPSVISSSAASQNSSNSAASLPASKRQPEITLPSSLSQPPSCGCDKCPQDLERV